MRVLKTPGDIEEMLKASYQHPVFLFKHSASCPISHNAHYAVETVSQVYPIYKVVVQHHRELSNQLAQDLNVRHASPQLIALRDGLARGMVSHGAIRSEVFHQLSSALSQ